MIVVAPTEPSVPTKKKPTPPGPAFIRVEIQAQPDWLARVDAAADALGLSRSAYIRMACSRQMDRDRQEQQRRPE